MAKFSEFSGKLKFMIAKGEVERDFFKNTSYFSQAEFRQESIWNAYNLNKKSIEDDIKKKYMNFDQNKMNIILDEARKQELNEEVKDTMKDIGINSNKEVDKVSEKVQEEETKGSRKNKSKDELKADIIKAAAYSRAKDYEKEVLKQKASQIEDKRIGLTPKEAAKDIREEVLLKEMNRKYKKITHKDLSDNKSIKNLQKDIENKTEGLQKGAENRQRNEFSIREALERKVQEKEREYNEAIARNDPKVDEYKKEYEKACYELVNLKNSQKDYSEQLETQKELEDKADKKGVLHKSAVAQEINYKNHAEKKISESNTTKSFQKGVERNERQEEKTNDIADTHARELKRDERYGTLENIEAQRKNSEMVDAHISNGQIKGVKYNDTFQATKNTMQKNEQELRKSKEEKLDDFMGELRSNVRSENEKANDVVNERAYKEFQEKNKEDAQKYNKEAQRMRRNKKGNPNN